MHTKILVLYFLIFFSHSAQAYIGPGIGAGTLAAIAGVIVSIFAAMFAIIYYPIKRMLRKRKGAKEKIEQRVPAANAAGQSEKRDQN